jgi:hypothetical protein
METGIKNRSDQEFKTKILKEIKETGNAALVARTHGLNYQTVAAWVRSERKAPARKKAKELKSQEIRLQKLELENRILKELLKKTNQVWLSDDSSQIPS